MIDIAREQSPKTDQLYRYASVAQSAGFDALGLYLEHRFRYPGLEWAHGEGALAPTQIEALRSEFPSLQIVPFVNLLGHMGGFLSTTDARSMRTNDREVTLDPRKPGARELAQRIVEGTLDAFDSHLVHLGGDEPWILTSRSEISKEDLVAAYLAHYLPIIQMVESRGRTAALWADPARAHPEIAEALPKSVILFDWRYFDQFESVPKDDAGRTFLCPAAHSFTAPWLHIQETEKNIKDAVRNIGSTDAGFCLTYWEANLGSIFDSILPVAKYAMDCLNGLDADLIDTFESVDSAGEFATVLGIELPALGPPFSHENRRNPLRTRLLSHSDPFVSTRSLGHLFSQDRIEEALALCEKATHLAPSEPYADTAVVARSMIEFMKFSLEAERAYESGETSDALAKLAVCRVSLDNLEKVLRRANERSGASLADVHRAIQARRHVEVVIKRVEQYGRRELGYLPAFDVITDLHFVPHDQSRWRLFNRSTYDV